MAAILGNKPIACVASIEADMITKMRHTFEGTAAIISLLNRHQAMRKAGSILLDEMPDSDV